MFNFERFILCSEKYLSGVFERVNFPHKPIVPLSLGKSHETTIAQVTLTFVLFLNLIFYIRGPQTANQCLSVAC